MREIETNLQSQSQAFDCNYLLRDRKFSLAAMLSCTVTLNKNSLSRTQNAIFYLLS